jgi:hypothetical protein
MRGSRGLQPMRPFANNRRALPYSTAQVLESFGDNCFGLMMRSRSRATAMPIASRSTRRQGIHSSCAGELGLILPTEHHAECPSAE